MSTALFWKSCFLDLLFFYCRVCYCLRPWFAAEKQRDDAVPLVNGSLYKINFHRSVVRDFAGFELNSDL